MNEVGCGLLNVDPHKMSGFRKSDRWVSWNSMHSGRTRLVR